MVAGAQHRLTDVTLANLPGGTRPDLVHVETIRAELSIAALLRRELDVTRLTLTGPNILFELVGGAPNWLAPTLAPAAPGAADGGSRAPSLRVRAVHIQDGMITARFLARTKVVGVRSLDLVQPASGGPVDLSAVTLRQAARNDGGL